MGMKPSAFIIEGLDRLGKSSLIQGIIKHFGYHHIIHYSKPIKTSVYDGDFQYQYKSFQYGFDLLKQPKIPVIFDRFHLGETVYSNIYRGYDGGYVFNLEKDYSAAKMDNVKMILLTSSNLSFQKDDGDSFDWSKRAEEQQRFIGAFNKSVMPNKIMVDVHDGNGGYKPYDQILKEAIE